MPNTVPPYNEAARDIIWAENRLRTTSEEEAFTLRNFLIEEITTREGVDAYFEEENEFLDWNTDKGTAYDLAEAIAEAIRYPHDRGREALTDVALNLSLCPYHFVDYAICFDDDRPECAMIRFIHPSHDT